MAYRLKLKEHPSQSTQRILRELVGRCLEHIRPDQPDRSLGIHEARRTLKRTRALLRLMRTGLGDEVFKLENARYRDIARLLGGQRDRDVLVSTLNYLQDEHGSAGDSQFRLVMSIAETRNGQAGADGAELAAILAKARRNLKAAEREIGQIEFGRDDFSVVADGIETTLHRCSTAFARAADSKDAADWHDWRKTVQQHWRQMQLLNRSWPDYFDARAKLAAALSGVLGRAQDLNLLLQFLASPACATLAVNERRLLDIMAAESIERLREEAIPLGERLLAERPGGLRRRTETYWRTAGEARSAPKLTNRQAKERKQDA